MKKVNKKNNVPDGGSRISEAFFKHQTFLKKFLSHFLKREQDIEDVVQEVYLKAYSVEKERSIEQPKAFLFSIAKNLALNELNRKSRKMTDYIEECQPAYVEGSVTTIESEIEGQESLGLYCEAVASLPERSRRIYLLRKVHGLPHKEIAKRLGVSLSTVEKHLRMGTATCRAYMREDNVSIQKKSSVDGSGRV